MKNLASIPSQRKIKHMSNNELVASFRRLTKALAVSKLADRYDVTLERVYNAVNLELKTRNIEIQHPELGDDNHDE